MRICKRCFHEYEENEYSYDSPVAELADIFLGNTDTENVQDLCLQCRQEKEYFAAVRAGLDRNYEPMKKIFNRLLSLALNASEKETSYSIFNSLAH
jgi:hypothetical protein